MMHDPRTGARATPAPLAAALDPTTARALADAGYLHASDYVDLARANGWPAASGMTRPDPVPAMAQQSPRARPQPIAPV